MALAVFVAILAMTPFQGRYGNDPERAPSARDLADGLRAIAASA